MRSNYSTFFHGRSSKIHMRQQNETFDMPPGSVWLTSASSNIVASEKALIGAPWKPVSTCFHAAHWVAKWQHDQQKYFWGHDTTLSSTKVIKSQRLLQAHCEAKSILPWAQLGPTPSAVELKLRGTYDVVDGMLVVGWVDVVAMPPSKGCSICFSIVDSLPSWEFFLIMLS